MSTDVRVQQAAAYFSERHTATAADKIDAYDEVFDIDHPGYYGRAQQMAAFLIDESSSVVSEKRERGPIRGDAV